MTAADDILKDAVGIEEAAKIVGCSVKTLRNKMVHGIGPRNFKYLNRVYFKKKDLEAYMRRNVVIRAG